MKMKRILSVVSLILVMMTGSAFVNKTVAQYDSYDPAYGDQYDQNRDVTYQDFYDELSPYGQWVEYPGQGYVWVPDADQDFKPYSTNGHWVWSENYEWMWVSDYDWGWAPFHYGRWDYDGAYGWYWVPGYEWSPAWVAWRDGGDYYGWAPLRPGISINVNFNIGGYAPPVDFWCFAPRRYITSPRIYNYCVPRAQNVTIINYTTIITNNYRYSRDYGFRAGPRRYDAERYCGAITPVRFRQSYTPGRTTFRNNEISIYRPNVRRDNRNYAPQRFDRYDRNYDRTSASNNRFDRTNTSRGNYPGRDNNRFDRNDRTNGNGQPNIGNDRGNRVPGRNGNDNRPDNTGGPRFDRTERPNGNGQPSTDRGDRWPNRNNPNTPGNTPDRGNTGGPGYDRPQRTRDNVPPSNGNTRRFERQPEVNTTPSTPGTGGPRYDRPQRSQENTPGNGTPRYERPQRTPDNVPSSNGNTRRFERQPEVNNTPPVVRQREQPQRQPQMERRMESRPSQPQQQPRQFERRQEAPSNGGGGGRESRRRF